MKMSELIRYEVPPEVIVLWQQRESATLLPIQEMAVRRFELFGSGNLLIQAPTSSGKTFIGEMAAIHTALHRKKVVYLVPLKALAEEKYLDFKEKYQAYGLKVLISTRDHREQDRDFEDGDFSLAVVVYEKLAQLLVRRPERLEQIDLIIADELELLSDPERGAMVELLLTRILQAGRRLIGLSAVIGHPERLAEWMNARLVYYERRPVELRYGVLHQGKFKYRTYNEGGEDVEPLVDAGEESSWETLTQNVCAFAGRGEACLIFVKAKHESRRGAELLCGRLDLGAAVSALDELRRLEPTRSRDCLLNTLNHGVGFHNADLSPEERHIVEEAFRAGEVKVLVSTSTLAVGLNLPAQNVFLSTDKWRYDARLGMPWKTPILRAEYENMSGRAGRYGAGHAFGRSLLVASTPFDFDTFWRRYVEGEREPIDPRLARESLENHVLRLVASRFCRTAEELLDFLENTLTGKWVWAELYPRDEVAFLVRGAVNRCLDAGVVAANAEGRLEATPLGLAVAAKGISIATARQLEHWIGESETRDWSAIDLIFAAASTPDGQVLQVTLTAREYERADYPGRLKRLTRDEPICADVPMNRIRNCNLQPFFEEVRAIKIALFLNEWIQHAAIHSLEEDYDTMAGQMLAAADQISWIVDATSAVAGALGADTAFVERLRILSERVQHGLDEPVLPLARARIPGLTRSMLIALAADGLYTPEALRQSHVKALARGMPDATARALKTWAENHASLASPAPPETMPAREAQRPMLIVDDRTPGEIVVDGVTVPLQDKQYRLIRILAQHPGICVPYETIYQAVWGDVIVEDNQMCFQKSNLVKRIKKAAPHHAQIIRTIPKRGFLLDLPPESILFHPMPISNAA
jgi:helicase